MHNLRADTLDTCVWGWLSHVFERPENIVKGLRWKRAEQEQASQVLKDRLTTIDEELATARQRLARLVDLYMATSSQMSREIFTEKEKELNTWIRSWSRNATRLRCA